MNEIEHCFEYPHDRTSDGSLKWAFPSPWLPENVTKRPVPLWIADMDFISPPAVNQALGRMAEHGIYGYTDAPESLREALAGWQYTHHQWAVKTQWMLHSPGIVSALNLTIQTFSAPGDGVMMLMPVYGPFHDSVGLNQRRVVPVELELVGQDYVLDIEKFEAAITPDVKIFILSNPHNPIGKVWSREELLLLGECCLRHNILVIADEIHQDLVISSQVKYLPFASLCAEFSDISITCTAPSKTFNLAGLQTSTLIISNPQLRQRLHQHYVACGLERPNIAGIIACEAAYRNGEPWLNALLSTLRDNLRQLDLILKDSGMQRCGGDALYLAWIDCRRLQQVDLQHFFLEKSDVWIEPGTHFGRGGDGFIRLNYATSRTLLTSALRQMVTAT